MKTKAKAAWQEGDNLILSFPSSREGYYLVKVSRVGDYLKVAHSCPAVAHGRNCWHVQAAAEAYREWRWWEEKPKAVHTVHQPVILSPHWEQIPVPGTEAEILLKGVV